MRNGIKPARFVGVIAGLVYVFGLTCTANAQLISSKWQRNRAETIPYKVGWKNKVTVESVDGRHLLKSKGPFGVTLIPREGATWNMERVSILGVMMKNTGQTDITLYLTLGNVGATAWSKSALGCVVIKAGEELPLVVVLGRKRYESSNPHYNLMSGKPNGHRRHWHTIMPGKVKNLYMYCPSKGAHAFELAEMFPYEKMDDSALGTFPFVDQYGQHMHREWPGKVRTDRDIVDGIEAEKKLEAELAAPTGFSRYGGWKQGPRFEATGAFRTRQHEGRWWFVDPEGYLFWSYGVTCVGIDWAEQSPLRGDLSVFADLPAKDDPEFGPFFTLRDVEGPDYNMIEDMPHYDFTRANLYRKYGKDWVRKSAEQTARRMRYCKLNTIGAWSDDNVVALRQVPYTAMVHYEYAFAKQKLPDPFDPETRDGLRKSLREYPLNIQKDPWCVGAFVNNELRWENSAIAMVTAILTWPEEGTAVKRAFRDRLKERYESLDAFNTSWKTSFASWDDLLAISGPGVLKNAKKPDCSMLATYFANTFFKMVKDELNAYAPGLLYLGCRMNSGADEVLDVLANYADVISANIYRYRPDIGKYGSLGKPVLISEFHFVDNTGCNLGSGLRAATDAVQQGRLFRHFMELAVNHPKVVGAHWFQWNDQNVTGRYDGENYDVGFFDIADKPNEELIRAAEAYGRILYESVK